MEENPIRKILQMLEGKVSEKELEEAKKVAEEDMKKENGDGNDENTELAA